MGKDGWHWRLHRPLPLTRSLSSFHSLTREVIGFLHKDRITQARRVLAPSSWHRPHMTACGPTRSPDGLSIDAMRWSTGYKYQPHTHSLSFSTAEPSGSEATRMYGQSHCPGSCCILETSLVPSASVPAGHMNLFTFFFERGAWMFAAQDPAQLLFQRLRTLTTSFSKETMLNAVGE